MKRAFLRSVAAMMIACMFVLTGGGFTSREVELSDSFTEIIVNGVDDSQKEQQIIATLNGEILISPMNILCIFGHSMSQTTAVTIEHRYWAASPRCRQTTHRVDYCTRSGCNYMVLTQLSQRAIQCCS